MSSTPEEFSADPLKIYHATRDSDGERTKVEVTLPASLVHEMDVFMRRDETKTFITRHHFLLNCLIHGSKFIQEQAQLGALQGLNEAFETEMGFKDIAMREAAKANSLEMAKHLYNNGSTPTGKAEVRAEIIKQATIWESKDPELAEKFRQILS